jgi:TonB family protein
MKVKVTFIMMSLTFVRDHRVTPRAAMLALLLHGLTAHAQERPPPEPAPDGAEVAFQPPELLVRAEADYPEAARAQRVEGRVVLRVTIDREGLVTQVDLIEPAGHGFDEAAREAASRCRFRPGRQRGKPVAVRILFPYDFRLPAEAAPAPTPAPVLGPAAEPKVGAEPTALVTPAPAAVEPEPKEVTVVGERNEAEELQQSAEAVTVVSTRKARRETADLGEVLARTQGVAVRRSGGLGSDARFSLNGLYDEQIRFFLDGVPLDGAGFPFGVANVPVNLIERVEVYRGVVPIRFGADALGGAVNLVSDDAYDTHAGASYQVGSFGTHRVTADGRWRHGPSGIVLGAATFFDVTKNDYDVDVEIPDGRGRPQPATVPRFHDRYRAWGGVVEAGVVERPWARRLLLRGFYSTYDKELQHNLVMTVPYGEVSYGESVAGATLRYEADLRENVSFELVGSYARTSIDYSDQTEWSYWWNGRIRKRSLGVGGEIDGKAHDQRIWTHSAFGRGLVEWKLTPAHAVRASLTPSFATRSGDERIQADPTARDPLTAQRELFQLVSGVEHQLDVFHGKLSNVVFVKDYLYDAKTEEPVTGGFFRRRDRASHTRGVGDSLRYRFAPWLYAKASYEYATRLPRADEVFGNGVLILANLELEPEVSHNANIGPRFEARATPAGDFVLDVNAFLRDSDRLIVLLGNDRTFTYQNVYRARGLGLENALSWVSPRRYVNLDGMLTWQDVRNASSAGTFGKFDGDRIPNRPYLFGSWAARLHFEQVLDERDAIEPYYHGRYVHEFFRGWESVGIVSSKQTVDSQVTHAAGVSWRVTRDFASVTSTFEVDNLTNAKAFDNYGVQRPGRAFYLKVTGEL